MPDLEIMIFNQKIKLSYQDNEKERLIKAVESLNKRWNKLSNLHGRVSDLKIIILISLELQDLIQELETVKVKNNESENKLKQSILQKNEEISKIETVLEEINDELLQINKNLLNQNE